MRVRGYPWLALQVKRNHRRHGPTEGSRVPAGRSCWSQMRAVPDYGVRIEAPFDRRRVADTTGGERHPYLLT